MSVLRTPSPRPEFLADSQGNLIQDPTNQTQVGMPGPLGRERVVSALPLGSDGPFPPLEVSAVVDTHAGYLADPSNSLIGFTAPWVPRMLAARWTEDTRRVSG